MISAFGVEHTISKSKAPQRIVRMYPKKSDDLNQRLRVNYSQWRSKVWYEGRNAAKGEAMLRRSSKAMGPKTRGQDLREKSVKMSNPKRIAAAQETKRYANAQIEGIQSINRRRPDRHLP